MTVLKDVTATARKDYCCDLCGCTIKKGYRYYRQSIIDCGKFYDFKNHNECGDVAWLLNMYQEYDDGLSDYDFQAWIWDYLSGRLDRSKIPDDCYEQVKLIIKMNKEKP